MRHCRSFSAIRSAKCLALIACALLFVTRRAESASRWVEERVAGPFVCRSEFRLRGDEAWLEDLERLTADIEQSLGLEIPEASIEVSLFRSRRSYREFLSHRVPGGQSRRALFVQGPDMGRVYVYHHRDYATDLRHECTHALLHAALPFVPLWLDEGLAEYFEVPPHLRTRKNPHLKGLKTRILFGWQPDLNRLENVSEFTDFKDYDYRDAWAWVHFMLHGPDRVRQILPKYLFQIRNGSPPGRLSEHLSREIPQLERQLVSHLKRI